MPDYGNERQAGAIIVPREYVDTIDTPCLTWVEKKKAAKKE
jgi:hypothetical protein